MYLYLNKHNIKFGKVHLIKFKKIEDVTHNFGYFLLLN